MDAKMYSEAIQYEQLTRAVYQAILQKEGVNNIQVKHNIGIKGRSGVEHQIDVLWCFKQAGIEHKVIIECKNYASSLTLEKVRNFFAVIHDIGNVQGLMVTKTGYQTGAADFANYYGIALKILRKPTDEDWKGRIKDIHLNITAKFIASTDEKPLSIQTYIRPVDEEQDKRIKALIAAGRLKISSGADLCFLDRNGLIATKEMRCWLPSQLEILDKEDGGPYTERIELKDKFILVNAGELNQELVQAIAIEVTIMSNLIAMRSLVTEPKSLKQY